MWWSCKCRPVWKSEQPHKEIQEWSLGNVSFIFVSVLNNIFCNPTRKWAKGELSFHRGRATVLIQSRRVFILVAAVTGVSFETMIFSLIVKHLLIAFLLGKLLQKLLCFSAVCTVNMLNQLFSTIVPWHIGVLWMVCNVPWKFKRGAYTSRVLKVSRLLTHSNLVKCQKTVAVHY